LHLSKEEQRLRLLKRLETGDDNWKFSTGDLKERALWDEYMKYYEEAINKTTLAVAKTRVVHAETKYHYADAIKRIELILNPK
jgi:polyphosphate kinase 2 (PPK2 family)